MDRGVDVDMHTIDNDHLQLEADMRTTLNIDDEALAQAMQYAEGRTKTSLVNEALLEYARRRRTKELLDLRGRVEWVGDLDALRERR